ncbi:novel acetylcholine receptor chaperone-like [Paramacrobiotus metropolitanus]|uniref:novel acetylcholine receptor chaperone-like n=1 Tax=Paramacrobiotus metropolitanus TaxID=2943436 RepID=UPI0024460FDE|nr:novel acetylcholine receptor chaperone-like [Paramacrobiotus metropolitanus]
MAQMVLTALSISLGIFFCFVGTLKLTQVVSYEMHKDLKKNFAAQAKVFPVLSQLGVKVSPKVYREAVGWTEVVCGLALLLMPGAMKQIANVILFLVVSLAIYSHWKINDRLDRIAPAIVFALMLVCRFVINAQLARRKNSAASGENHVERKVD